MSWTEDRVTLLTRLWGEGHTAAEIAKKLGGVTRNAVIGKAHRLKLSNRMSPIQQNSKKAVKTKPAEPKKTKSAVKKPSLPKETLIVKAAFDGKGVKMIDLTERMCRWPIGDPKDADFKFCGCKKIAGVPYCDDHSKIAYQVSSRSRTLKAEDFEKSSDENVAKDQEIAVAS